MWWSENEQFWMRVSWVLLPALIALSVLGALLAKSLVPVAVLLIMLSFGIVGAGVALLPVALVAVVARLTRRFRH